MNIRFYNAWIAPFAGGEALTSGEVWVTGERIAMVGAPGKASAGVAHPVFDREIDCRGNLLLPGFKNAHSHAGMTFLRSLADDLPLQNWLYDCVFPREGKLTPEAQYALTRLAILEYIAGGVTAAFDMYFYRDAVAAAAIDSSFRMCLTDGVNDFGGSAARAEAEYDRLNALHPLISYQLAVHGEYTTKRELLKDMAQLVQKKRAPLFSHMNETKAEVAGCVARYGMRPFELFDSIGMFDFGGGGFHCVHLSENEMDIMARRRLFAITCPASNLKLGSGVPPVYELQKKGVRIAIGTDGPASNNALDFFREMYLTAVLPKIGHGADAVDAVSVLESAVKTGALAMGLPNCDSLLPGKQADMVLLDMMNPAMQPVNNVLKNVVYAGTKQLVKMTMIAGKIVYEDGEYFVGTDAEKIMADARNAAKGLLG